MENPAIKNRRSLGPAGPGLAALLITAALFFIPFIAAALPAPIAYARFRYGIRGAAIAALVSIGFTGAATASYLLVTGIACLCVSGFVMGDSLARGGRDDLAVLKGTAAPFVIGVPVAVAHFISRGTTPTAFVKRWLEMSLNEFTRVYSQVGMSQADIDALMPSVKTVINVITGYYPAIAVGAVAVSALLSYALVKGRLVKAGALPAPAVPFSNWQAPDHLVWGIIIPGFLLIPDVAELRLVAGNVLAVFALVYLFQGYAILRYLFDRLKLSAVPRGIGYFLIFVQPFLIAGMWAVGFFDTWVDFRKLRPKKTAK